MIYVYRCRVCGAIVEGSSRNLRTCPECLNMALGRDYSTVQFGTRAFRPHFNHAVGRYVSSPRQFDDALKAAGDAAGSPLTRVDPGDVPVPDRDTEALEAQARIIHDRGIDPRSLT